MKNVTKQKAAVALHLLMEALAEEKKESDMCNKYGDTSRPDKKNGISFLAMDSSLKEGGAGAINKVIRFTVPGLCI